MVGTYHVWWNLYLRLIWRLDHIPRQTALRVLKPTSPLCTIEKPCFSAHIDPGSSFIIIGRTNSSRCFWNKTLQTYSSEKREGKALGLHSASAWTFSSRSWDFQWNWNRGYVYISILIQTISVCLKQIFSVCQSPCLDSHFRIVLDHVLSRRS